MRPLLASTIILAACGGTVPATDIIGPPSPDLARKTVTVVIPQNETAPPSCVPADVRDPATDCYAVDVTRDDSGAVLATTPIAACAANPASPCWLVVPGRDGCARGEFAVERSTPPPPATTAEAICAVDD